MNNNHQVAPSRAAGGKKNEQYEEHISPAPGFWRGRGVGAGRARHPRAGSGRGSEGRAETLALAAAGASAAKIGGGMGGVMSLSTQSDGFSAVFDHGI